MSVQTSLFEDHKGRRLFGNDCDATLLFIGVTRKHLTGLHVTAYARSTPVLVNYTTLDFQNIRDTSAFVTTTSSHSLLFPKVKE